MNRLRLNAVINTTTTVVLVLALALLPWLVWKEGFTSRFLKYWWRGNFSSGFTTYDNMFRTAAGQSNAAIRLVDFNSSNPQHISFAQLAFCRGAYTLYPRRAWAAEEGTILNGGRDAIEANFKPNFEWLRAHQVYALILFKYNARGDIEESIVVVPPEARP